VDPPLLQIPDRAEAQPRGVRELPLRHSRGLAVSPQQLGEPSSCHQTRTIPAVVAG
jgi:hypothetical protein